MEEQLIEKLMSHVVGIQNLLFPHLFTIGDFSEDELQRAVTLCLPVSEKSHKFESDFLRECLSFWDWKKSKRLQSRMICLHQN